MNEKKQQEDFLGTDRNLYRDNEMETYECVWITIIGLIIQAIQV